MNRKAIKVLFVFWILGLMGPISLPLRAQVAGATISGAVTDSQGGVVPGAKVSVRNQGTGITVETTTNGAGAYAVPNLNPADYEVSVSAPGFSTAVSKVTLTVGAQQELNFPLTVGEVTQTVEVAAGAPQIELASSTISDEVTATTVRELPLNGRDWTSLATLQPGVASVRTHPVQTTATSRGTGLQLTVSGNRPTQNVYRLDGAITNDYSNSGPGNVLNENLGVDAIQEFSVLTSNYSAEYGFTSGGVINAVTRSGTNTFHGSAFDFFRNDSLDAANFFSNSAGLPKNLLQQNQFGASGGWRILKDRVFLFGDYEGVRQNAGTPQLQFTISNAVRAGNVTNLSTGAVSAVPIDPNIQKFLVFFPAPNGPALNANVGEFNWDGVRRTSENFLTFRADQKLSNKDSLVETYVRDPSHFFIPTALDTALSENLAYRQIIVLEETHLFSASLANTVRGGYDRSNLLSSHLKSPSQAINPAANDPSLAILPGPFRAPGITLSGTSITGSPGGLYYGIGGQESWGSISQLFDDAFVTRGNHGLKFGFMFLALQNNFSSGGGNGGGTFTSALATSQAKADCTRPAGGLEASCGTLVNFLTNQPRTASVPADQSVSFKHYLRAKVFAGYVQDDWRLRPSLTVNLGLRYEMETNITDPKPQVGYLRTLYSPTTDLVSYFYDHNPTLKNFEPRIGFAWDPFHNGKTAVRGGFGLFDALPSPYIHNIYTATIAPFNSSFAGSVGPPNTAVIPQGAWPYGIPALSVKLPDQARTWGYIDNNIKRNYVYQYNFNIQRQITSSLTLVVAYAGSRGVHNPFLADTANSVLPVNVHHPIPGVGYYWPIPYTLGAIPAVCNPAAGNLCGSAALQNPNVGSIRSVMFQSSSFYNALQVKVDKRLSHGFQVQGSFTWSKSIDDISGSATGDTFDNDYGSTPWWDLRLDRGLSSFNIPRNLVINGLWNVPTPQSLGTLGGRVLGGWQLGLITSASDGSPTGASMGLDGSDLLGEVLPTLNPPNLVGGPGCASLDNPRNPNEYFKQQCFSLVPQTAANTPFCDTARATALGVPGTCPNIRGDMGRNALTGPGLFDVDFSILKNNYIRRISEAFNVQFRAEFFNLMNRANFAQLQVAAGTGAMEVINSAGQPTAGFARLNATETPNRQIQFALKVVW